MGMQQLDISRLLWSAFLHADELHIFYNMSSFLWKVHLLPLMCSTSDGVPWAYAHEPCTTKS